MGSHNFYSFSKVKNFLSSEGNRWKLVVIVFVLLGMSVGVKGATQAGTWNGNTGVFSENYLNATIGYYLGTTNITPYIQNANPDGDANFSSVEADDIYARGSYNVTQLAMYPQQPASYIVWGDPPAAPTIYYAKNGTTGAIDYSGADAETVIESTVAEYRKIHVKNGTYLLSNQLDPVSNMIFEGEGSGTIFKIKDDVNDEVIYASGKSNMVFRDFVADGNEANELSGGLVAHTIQLVTCSNIKFENVESIHSSYDCFLFSGNSKDISLVNCIAAYARDDGFNPLIVNGISYSNCLAYNNTKDGFHQSVGSKYVSMSGCISYNNGEFGTSVYGMDVSIIGNNFYNNTFGSIYVDGSANYTEIIGNNLFGGDTGIKATGGIGNEISGLIIQSNHIYNPISWGVTVEYCPASRIVTNRFDGPTTNFDAIYIKAGSKGTLVSGNVVVNSARRDLTIIPDEVTISCNNFTGVLNIAGANHIFESNRGYITENAGNATLAAITSSIAVNHGCAYTPTLGDIQVTPSRDLGNCTYYWIDTITATQFTIHVGAAGAEKNIDKTVYFLWSVRRH